jgi:hypothetical protein
LNFIKVNDLFIQGNIYDYLFKKGNFLCSIYVNKKEGFQMNESLRHQHKKQFYKTKTGENSFALLKSFIKAIPIFLVYFIYPTSCKHFLI